MKLGDKYWPLPEVRRRTGRVRQICGVRAAQLLDGTEAGVRAIDLFNEKLRLTVYPDRGMDLGTLTWRGCPLTWESPTGVVHPTIVDTTGYGWGKGFHGGLAVSCGLENVGPPCEDGGKWYGQHGTLSYTPAADVAWREETTDTVIRTEVEGEVPGADGLSFRRKVSLVGGANVIWVVDRIYNPTAEPIPWMIQYHMNFGFPLLSEAARVLIPPGRPLPRDEGSALGLSTWDQVQAPEPGYGEQVFRHQQKPDPRGYAYCGIVNDSLGLGVLLRYPTGPLPYLWQWRIFAPQRYVLALEPSNCLVKPRSRAREEGILPTLAPKSAIEISLQVVVVEGREPLLRLKHLLA
ncbi:MAG: aldose 1-epimerase family protein [Firmicutes bacterium]|nr:aldose 1-epimerase family protein [Bacillota bacterium]MCL5039302.1 aldose 1-epimerase family protein [Bacillota bacterium]